MAAHRLASRARLRAENNDLACRVVQLAREVGALQVQLDEAGIDLSGAREDRRTAKERAERLAAELAAAVAEVHALRAQVAQQGAVTVADWVRPVDGPQDVATAPLDVAELRNGWKGAA